MNSEGSTNTTPGGQGIAPNASNVNAHGAGGRYQATAYGFPHQYYHYPHKKLYRSRTDKYLGGVSGGMARYFNTDPLLVRVAWVVLTVASFGAGVIGYLAFWALTDKEPTHTELRNQYTTTDSSGRVHQHNTYRVS